MAPNIEKAKASKPLERFIPNPKLKLLDQMSKVMRFKHYSIRTEPIWTLSANSSEDRPFQRPAKAFQDS
ncbi:MAG TPA: hypothetical protein VEC99_19025 [Clostridia bacterium]|nr:hypothetical protein [Clostridia bacterium]